MLTIWSNLLLIHANFYRKNISVLDLSGRMLMSAKATGDNTIVDLLHLQNGVYFVKVKTAAGESTVKLVKQ